MRHKILQISLVALCIFQSKEIVCQWLSQNSGINTSISSCYFINDNSGWCVGTNGKIIKTINGGLNWILQTSGTTVTLESCFFKNANTGWIVGGNTSPSSSKILKTTNGGTNWQEQASGTNNYLISVYFIDDNIGYVSGKNGTILKTSNGGNNWINQSINSVIQLNSIQFIDYSKGYIVGGYPDTDGLILKTSNGGSNWLELPFGTSDKFYSTYFTDANTGWAVGTSIFKTINGGSNWINQLTIIGPFGLLSVNFVNSNTGYSVGFDSLILKTTNGGSNWTNQISERGGTYYSIFFTNNLTGWIGGYQGVLLKTTNGGDPIGIQPISSEIPMQINLYQNYPNPFNPTTSIKFDITQSGTVKLIIFDILGHEIITMIDQELHSGTYQTEWEATNYPNGIYYYRLETKDFIETKKMILVK